MSNKDTTALATVPQGMALVPQSFEEAEKLAERLAKCSLLPDHFKGKPADVFWALAYGIEIGMTPINALQSIYVVHGRPGMYSDAMVALVLQSELCEGFEAVEVTATQATYKTTRVLQAPRSLTVTMVQAKQAGWTSNKKYQTEPERMLAARCRSALCKEVYPDVLRGMASVEDLRDDGSTAMTAPPAPVSSTPPRGASASPVTAACSSVGEVEVCDAEIVEENGELVNTQTGEVTSKAHIAEPPAAPGDGETMNLAMDLIQRMEQASDLDELKAIGKEVSALPVGSAGRDACRSPYASKLSTVKNGDVQGVGPRR